MFFKRNPNEVTPICFHKWKIADYISYVDSSLGVEDYYELGCVNCGEKRTVDEYSLNKMRKIGLIIEGGGVDR